MDANNKKKYKKKVSIRIFIPNEPFIHQFSNFLKEKISLRIYLNIILRPFFAQQMNKFMLKP